MPIVTPVVIRRNRVANRKTKNKTGATRYARQSRVEGYLKKLVLGSAPSTGSWVGARAFDPTSLPSGSWNVTPTANGKKQKGKEKTDRDTQGPEKRSRDQSPGKKPSRANQDRQDTGYKTVSLFVFVSAGSGVGALCLFWGRRPRAVHGTLRLFSPNWNWTSRTGGQRRSSPEPQMVARPQRWSFERF